MGGFSSELIRVTIDGSSISIVPDVVTFPPGTNLTLKLQHACNLAYGYMVRDTIGGVIYLEPGVYDVVEAAGSFPTRSYTPSLLIPLEVTLRLAPGAVLRPAPGVVIDVEGMIEAGPYKIFDTSAGGFIVFSSSRIREICPEWWGAVGNGTHDDSAALQAALDSAINLRTVRSSIPVRLGQTYKISSQLEVGIVLEHPLPALPPARFAGFVIRGSRGPNPDRTVKPTLIAGVGADGSPLQAMLLARGAFGFRIDGVTWDGNGQAETCLRVESTLVNASAQASSINSCAFRGATVQQVLVGPRAPSALRSKIIEGRTRSEPTKSTGLNLGMDISSLGIEECNFVIDEVATDASCGIVLQAAQALGIRIARCNFSGRARAMVRLFSGGILIESCNFANGRRPEAVDVSANSLVSVGEPTGVDIHLSFQYAELIGSASGVNTFLSPLGPASLTVVHCTSTSWRFLETYRPGVDPYFREALPDGNVLLINVRQFRSMEMGVPTEDMPSVYWDYPFARADMTCASDLLVGVALVLVGCHFDGYVYVGRWARVVANVATSFSPAVAGAGPRRGFASLSRVPIYACTS